jgi:hypothetical protein
MTKLNYFFIPVCCLLLGGCAGKQSSEGTPQITSEGLVDIDVVVPKSPLPSFADYIEDVRFIPIETDSLNLIGGIDKISVYNDDYYILDKWQTKTLWRVDRQGKLLNKIGRVGRGPGEFIEPTDFTVNSSGIIVLDHYARRLLFYDFDGTFRKETPLQFIITAITSMKDEGLIFAITGDNRRNKTIVNREFVIINTEGELIHSGIINKYRLNYSRDNMSLQLGDKIVYYRPMHNIIYGITSDGAIQERFKINIGDSPLPSDYEKKCSGDYENFMDDYMGKYSYFSGVYSETNRHLLFTTERPGRALFWTIYQKDTGATATGSMTVAFGGGKPLTPEAFIPFGFNSLFSDGDDFVGSLDAQYLAGKTSVNSLGLLNIDEYSNPVIFRFKIKSSSKQH